MMEYQQQLKVQAYLDGELPEAEMRQVEAWLARDQHAADLLGELRNTREALAGADPQIPLPESREFYWSKIQREIQRLETPGPAAVRSVSWSARLRRILMPVSGVAVAALLLLVVTRENGSNPTTPPDTTTETALEDSGAFTYHDSSAGVTLVWLSYPADDVIDNDENSLD